eukprot:CAMPEP_0183517142 /NCGR_PEP_ID=MMETSP0371-20130417/14673_1 /TAXON_ID=268820 /ORGANISM="Peridinium aciculiferum, Strain PAER-2" /LENGTH=204 /DNA_ID=CAMNT_0025714973 /DNA_START=178 /DNA_END=793 /DNA_ORIENTATION=+
MAGRILGSQPSAPARTAEITALPDVRKAAGKASTSKQSKRPLNWPTTHSSSRADMFVGPGWTMKHNSIKSCSFAIVVSSSTPMHLYFHLCPKHTGVCKNGSECPAGTKDCSGLGSSCVAQDKYEVLQAAVNKHSQEHINLTATMQRRTVTRETSNRRTLSAPALTAAAAPQVGNGPPYPSGDDGQALFGSLCLENCASKFKSDT